MKLNWKIGKRSFFINTLTFYKYSIFQYSPNGDKKSFVNVDRVDQKIRDSRNDNLLTIRFVKDYNYDSYERQVFSLLDLFGNLGGLFEVLFILGGLTVGSFIDKLFHYSIISSFYQVDPLPKDEKLLPDESLINDNYEKSKIDAYKNNQAITKVYNYNQSNGLIEEDKSFDNRENQGYDTRKTNSQILSYSSINSRSKLMSKAKNSLLNRRFYNYSISDFSFNLLWCVKSCMWNKNKPYGFYNRHALYK